MSKIARISTYAFVSIIIGAIILACVDLPLGTELNTGIKIAILICGTIAFGLISITWIQILEKYYNSIQCESEQDKELSLDEIELAIRKEGYLPERVDDKIVFKIAGEMVYIFYQDDKLSFVKEYALSDDVDIDAVSMAIEQLHDSTFLIRGNIHTYSEGTSAITFEVQALTNSTNELNKFINDYLHILLYGIERHRNIYEKLTQESAETSDVYSQSFDKNHLYNS